MRGSGAAASTTALFPLRYLLAAVRRLIVSVSPSETGTNRVRLWTTRMPSPDKVWDVGCEFGKSNWVVSP